LLRRLAPVLALWLVFAVSACGQQPAQDRSDATTGAGDPHELEATTPRGLAAAVSAHLQDTTFVGGREDAWGLWAFVETERQAIESVHVTIAPSSPGSVGGCGGDSGYATVMCHEGDQSLMEIMTSTRPGSQRPTLQGRVVDPDRGDVLVQVWGVDTETTRQLVAALLADHLIGVQTSVAINDAGRRLAEFEETSIEVSGEDRLARR
jgi:hypothetical protein